MFDFCLLWFYYEFIHVIQSFIHSFPGPTTTLIQAEPDSYKQLSSQVILFELMSGEREERAGFGVLLLNAFDE